MKKVFFCVLVGCSLYAATQEKKEGEQTTQGDKKLTASVENLGPVSDGYPPDRSFGPERDIMDSRVLRDFLETKGLISCRQKCGALVFAGDMRTRWMVTGEKINGHKGRGTGTKTALHRFASDLSLFFDYTAKDSWASGKVRWSFFAGKDGGSAVRVEVDRVFIGYDLCHCNDLDCYIECGRSALYFLFESKVEFSSTFDGIHLYYTDRCPWCTYTLHGGPFITDSYTNHYGWVGELYLKNLFGKPISFKWNVIDWSRHAPVLNYGNNKLTSMDLGTVTVQDNPRYSFYVSQWLLGYTNSLRICGRDRLLYAYGAFIHNFSARPSFATHNRKEANGWYIGCTLGKVCQAGDWSFDLSYQAVQAQAVPEFDLSGIGHGNAPLGSLTKGPLLSDTILANRVMDNYYTSKVARGFCNYKGVELVGIYALSETFSLKAKAQVSTPITRVVGGDFFYKNFELAAIYAF